MSSREFITIGVLLLSFCNFIANADIIHVPGDYTTLQAGIAAAQNGDTVLVGDGIYNDIPNVNLTWTGKHISVISENGPSNCIIDCMDTPGQRGFIFQNTGQNLTDKIQGFTIKDGNIAGDGKGGGMLCEDASLTIEDCVFDSNSVSGNNSYGGGLCLSKSSSHIINCTFRFNSTDNSGAGVGCSDGDQVIFEGCSFESNTAAKGGGGIHCSKMSLPDMRRIDFVNCHFTDNQADNSTTGCGGGLSLISVIANLVNCTISENTSGSTGGGLYCTDSTELKVYKCSFIQNNSYSHGGGLYINTASVEPPLIVSCIISENEAGYNANVGYGGGICIHHAHYCKVYNCIVYSNTAYSDGGGLFCGDSDDAKADIRGCTFTGNNSQTNFGEAIDFRLTQPNPNNQIINCILWNGSGSILVDRANVEARYCDIEDIDGNLSTTSCIQTPPDFIEGFYGNLYLNSGSACINTGDGNADSVFYPTTDEDIYMNQLTTQANNSPDVNTVDMGYHYMIPLTTETPIPSSTPTSVSSNTPLLTATQTPISSSVPTSTQTHTSTPTVSSTSSPMPTYTKTPSHTPTLTPTRTQTRTPTASTTPSATATLTPSTPIPMCTEYNLVWSDDFEGYEEGSYPSSGGWYNHSSGYSAVIDTSTAYEGSKSFKQTCAFFNIRSDVHLVPYSPRLSISIAYQGQTSDTVSSLNLWNGVQDSLNIVTISQTSGLIVVLSNNSGQISIPGQWVKLEVEIDFNELQYNFYE